MSQNECVKTKMSSPTTDDWLTVLGNKTRREILRLLSQEAHYPFQIAKNLLREFIESEVLGTGYYWEYVGWIPAVLRGWF